MTDEHPVVRTIRLANSVALARNFAELPRYYSDEFMAEDRRPNFRGTYSKAENLEQLRIIADLGIAQIDTDLIEARGDRCALVHLTFASSDGFIVPVLTVNVLDSEGRALRSVIFEEGDLDEARAELERLAG